MAVDTTITTWIPRANLALFLDRIAIFTGCQLDDLDRAAIASEIFEIEEQPCGWYSYPLAGRQRVDVAFAQAENRHHLRVCAFAQPHISNRIAASSQVLQVFDATAETYELDFLVKLAFEGWCCRIRIRSYLAARRIYRTVQNVRKRWHISRTDTGLLFYEMRFTCRMGMQTYLSSRGKHAAFSSPPILPDQ